MEELFHDLFVHKTHRRPRQTQFYSLHVAMVGGPLAAITVPTKLVHISTVPEVTSDSTSKVSLPLPLLKRLPLGGGAVLIEKKKISALLLNAHFLLVFPSSQEGSHEHCSSKVVRHYIVPGSTVTVFDNRYPSPCTCRNLS